MENDEDKKVLAGTLTEDQQNQQTSPYPRRWFLWATLATAVITMAVLLVLNYDILGSIFPGFYYCFPVNTNTSVLLIRHANVTYDGMNPNPSLNPDGKKRAEALTKVAKDAYIGAIYTSEYCRTVETAAPLAVELNLPIYIKPRDDNNYSLELCSLDPKPETQKVATTEASLKDKSKYSAELANDLLSKNSGQNILLVNHSDTVPMIANNLAANLITDPKDLSKSKCKLGNNFDDLCLIDDVYISFQCKRSAALFKAKYPLNW